MASASKGALLNIPYYYYYYLYNVNLYDNWRIQLLMQSIYGSLHYACGPVIRSNLH